MFKSERLIYITQAIKNRGPITAKQLATECSVTIRTIYRDILSLETLKVPIYYDLGKGYRIAMNTEFRFGQINNNDAELLLFCLYNSPLSKSPFFRRRLLYLKELLQSEFNKKSDFERDNSLLFDTVFEGLEEKHIDIVIKFMFALFHKRKVTVMHEHRSYSSLHLIPIAVRFKGRGATLILFDDQRHADLRIDIEDTLVLCIEAAKFADRPFTNKDKFGALSEAKGLQR